jgi:peptidoglycan biosynthesis protein MviN/MurJ (putative lipid II flippase)
MTLPLAANRLDDSLNLPLFIHILGAAILFGAVITMVTLTFTAERTAEPDAMRKLAFRSLLWAGLPAYIVMRVGAQWLYSKEHLDNLPTDPAWIGIGFGVADLGLLIFLIALGLSGFASRRRGDSGLARAAGILGAILIVALLIAVWAMGAKPN